MFSRSTRFIPAIKSLARGASKATRNGMARSKMVAVQAARLASTQVAQPSRFAANLIRFGAVGGVAAFAASATVLADKWQADWDQIRKEIVDIMDDLDYDDGSYGPLLVRLAWHASGTYDKASGTGGSEGATMRFPPESTDGANAGLHIARDLLEKVKRKHPEISYADLWTFAGSVAIEEMGGPKIDWRPGRVDRGAQDCPPNGRLPDAAQGSDHVRDVFYRMGLSDREIVALVGAHVLGRCHTDRSGFDGPWTFSPTTFSNEYFRLLKEEKWVERQWDGPKQYQDEGSRSLMMLPADMALLEDAQFYKWVSIYAKDQDRFFRDFAAAWKRLIEFNVEEFERENRSIFSKLLGR